MQLHLPHPVRHPLAQAEAIPARAQAIGLLVAALRVSAVAILFYLCTADWVVTGLPIVQLLREHRDPLLGIAAGWVAFEFLVFIVRARQAAQSSV
jgi:hypothetical protein